jgi:hypothetical protein
VAGTVKTFHLRCYFLSPQNFANTAHYERAKKGGIQSRIPDFSEDDTVSEEA